MWIAVSFVAELEPLVVIPCPAINHLNGQANTQHLPILNLYFSLPPRFFNHVSYCPVFRLRGLKYLRFFLHILPWPKLFCFSMGYSKFQDVKKISCRILSSRSTSESERISGWSGRGQKCTGPCLACCFQSKEFGTGFSFLKSFYVANYSLLFRKSATSGLNRNWCWATFST